MSAVQALELDKKERYAMLVTKRKQCHKCQDVVNPSSCESGRFDQNVHIGPWSDWQGNLNARIMVIGQEWGGTTNYIAQRGRDLDSDPTNKNLVLLMKSIDCPIPFPSELQASSGEGGFFFTNGVLCLRNGAATSRLDKKQKNDISDLSFRNCGQTFLRPQIEIIQPRGVFVLGKLPWNGLKYAFGLSATSSHTMNVNGDAVRLNSKTIAVPLFHCGARSINMNRDLPIQMIDWKRGWQAIEAFDRSLC